MENFCKLQQKQKKNKMNILFFKTEQTKCIFCIIVLSTLHKTFDDEKSTKLGNL